jgi:hypothetical protein
MNLFGCKFCKYIEVKHSKALEFECSRKNFDSLLWATLTVFQVIRNTYCSCFSKKQNSLSFAFDVFLHKCFVVFCFLLFDILQNSILGMHLFGGEFCTIEAINITSREEFDMKCRCCTCIENNMLKNHTDFKDFGCIQPRKNFDSLLYAILTVFQVSIDESFFLVLILHHTPSFVCFRMMN